MEGATGNKTLKEKGIAVNVTVLFHKSTLNYSLQIQSNKYYKL